MTWFWIYMLMMALLLPAVLIGFGAYFKKKAPRSINIVYGYRTSRSMKNMDTWVYAHRRMGKYWSISGWIVLPLTVIAMMFCYGGSEGCVGFFGTGVVLVQLVFLIVPIFFVERDLKKTFDEDGLRWESEVR